MSQAGDAIRAYAEATHRHVGDDVCLPLCGDRCDITAAYRNAARIADEATP